MCINKFVKNAFQDAICKLNSLQSNKSTIEQIKKGLRNGEVSNCIIILVLVSKLLFKEIIIQLILCPLPGTAHTPKGSASLAKWHVEEFTYF